MNGLNHAILVCNCHFIITINIFNTVDKIQSFEFNNLKKIKCTLHSHIYVFVNTKDNKKSINDFIMNSII